MPKSEAFIRIKADILAIVRSIPVGKITTYASIGHSLEVMARHVAYILTMLDDEEREGLPWYRVVSEKGELSKTKRARTSEQRQLLESEGIELDRKNRILHFESVQWDLA